ncbi:MAG TPA: hypothetical protein VJ600_04925 [Holophagaceae bacterium]|nr:hypothetical protein [Holophagaceae bacterium]
MRGPWLDILHRQTPGPLGWDDILVGHDFAFLAPEEIQAWVRSAPITGEAASRLASLRPDGLEGFEPALWAACAEATGKVPRPGDRRWLAAQDRWRLAILKDLLATDLTSQALAVAIEALYERVGCPEDMLALLSPSVAWAGKAAVVDPLAVAAFLQRHDRDADQVAWI